MQGKIVVFCNLLGVECGIGYINNDNPSTIYILTSSILKGYSGNGYQTFDVKTRLATKQDFEAYNLHGYETYKKDFETA